MAGIKKFKLGGIDLKSNDLVRNPMKASDLRNVIYNQKGDIDKVPGYELVETLAGETEEMVYYKTYNTELQVRSDGTIYKMYATRTIQDITYWATNPNASSTAISIAYTGGATAGSEVVTVSGNTISVQIQSGVSTATQVRTAILASSTALAIVGITITGTAATAQVTASATFLSVTRVSASIASLFPNVGLAIKNRIVCDEYLSNVYFTTSDGSSRVIKYDGSNAYLAGLPSPTNVFAGGASTITSSGAGYYFRFYYEFTDNNGNITVGPYFEKTSTISNPIITVSSFKTSNPYGAFFNKYLRIADTYGATLSATNPTMTVVSHNYAIGDQFTFDEEFLFPSYVNVTDTSGRTRITLTITAISGLDITFDSAQFGSVTVAITGGGGGSPINLDTKTRLKVFRSTSETFGFTRVNTFDVDTVIDNSQDNFASQTYAAVTDELFEDIYNEDGQKLRPPQCKYLCAYGDQLIFGNIVGVWNQLNVFTQYNNDDLLMYSDFGLADNGENHSANIQKIGESYDGSVTGIRRCNDLLLVTKENSLFAMDGIIEPGGYSLRKIPTNYRGCTSHNSILQVEGGLFFNSNDGIYFTDGVTCRKLTDLMDPFFNAIDGTKTKSSVNASKDRFIFYVTDNTNNYAVIYDFQYQDWFIRDTLDMSKGVFEENNGTLFFSKGTGIYKFNTGYSDISAAITAYYKTNWEDLGEPSLDKKFKYVRLWNLSSASTTFTLRLNVNWTESAAQADLTTAMTTDKVITIPAYSSKQVGFDQKNVQSFRMVFFNNTVAQNMIITGYELEYEGTQKIDKGN